jgi:hypothetical protein
MRAGARGSYIQFHKAWHLIYSYWVSAVLVNVEKFSGSCISGSFPWIQCNVIYISEFSFQFIEAGYCGEICFCSPRWPCTRTGSQNRFHAPEISVKMLPCVFYAIYACTEGYGVISFPSSFFMYVRYSCCLFNNAFSIGVDRLCGLVVRVLGYRSGGPGSIPGTTRKKNSKSGTGSTQPRENNWGATW